MIPAKKAVGISGSLPGESRRMAIAPDAMAHIMRILIDMYSDRELAVLRELATNAIDSHIMAKQQRPIEIETPGPLANYLVIRDFGLGLSIDEIFGMFGQYGASTKRETNEVTGMLGLGSKSPLTYTNQFTMVAIQNGVRATVSISREEDGVGNLTVVDTCATDEHNGVEIRVPARQGNKFAEKAKHLFKFWRKGTVLLNGDDPTGLGKNVLKISEDIYLIQNERYSSYHNYVVQGNVPYPVDDFIDNDALHIPRNYSLVAYVQIGTVEPTPSREAIQSGTRTNQVINKIIANFCKRLMESIQREIEQTPDGPSAVKFLMQWGDFIKPSLLDSVKWRGYSLPTQIAAPHYETKNNWGNTMYNYTGRILVTSSYQTYYPRRGANAQDTVCVSIDHFINGMWITGYDQNKWTRTHHKKALQWLSNQPQSIIQGVNKIIAVDWNVPDLDVFVPKGRIVSWETIKAEKLPVSNTATSGRIKGSFDVVLSDKKAGNSVHMVEPHYGVPGDKIDPQRTLFYVHGNINEARQYCPVLDRLIDHYTIICLPENRLNKFRRDYPHIKCVKDEINGRVKKLVDSLTDDEKKALAIHDSNWKEQARAAALVVEKIHDTNIQEAARLLTINLKNIIDSRDMFQREADWPETKVDNPFKHYSLLPYHTGHNPLNEEEVRYINNEWAFRLSQGLTSVA